MTDKELLKLAAKAAGFANWSYASEESGVCVELGSKRGAITSYWNPLPDDGDALRLAVKLGLSITPYPIYQPEKHSVIVKQRRTSDTMREANPTEVMEMYKDAPYAATRRAIVRAAAEIGKERK